VNGLLRQVPNTLSAFRLVAAPITAILILKGADVAAFSVFLCAGISDALDGYLAKKLKLISQFGTWLDPAADKLLMLASFIALTLVGAVPLWLTVAVIGRDVLIVFGVLSAKAMNAPLEVKPLIAGKVSTVAQMIYIALILLLLAGDWLLPVVVAADVALVALLAAWSFVAYAGVWFKAVIAAWRAGL
jgi:cardiolipin synthase (CMP-forming)